MCGGGGGGEGAFNGQESSRRLGFLSFLCAGLGRSYRSTLLADLHTFLCWGLQIHKEVFDKHYKQQYLEAGLLEKTRGELQHLISDAATMQVWTLVLTLARSSTEKLKHLT